MIEVPVDLIFYLLIAIALLIVICVWLAAVIRSRLAILERWTGLNPNLTVDNAPRWHYLWWLGPPLKAARIAEDPLLRFWGSVFLVGGWMAIGIVALIVFVAGAVAAYEIISGHSVFI